MENKYDDSGENVTTVMEYGQEKQIDQVNDDFCYLRSVVINTGGNEKDKTRIEKENVVFGRLDNV